MDIQVSKEKSTILDSLKQELINKKLISENKFNSKLLDNYDIIGFDIDHTLECYNMFNFPSLLYSSFSKYLVDYELYPNSLNIFNKEIEDENKNNQNLKFLTIENFEKFSCTEVLLDFETGNVIKIANDLTILKAFHGIGELSNDKINETYFSGKFPLNKNFDYNKSYSDHYFYIRGFIEFHICALFIFCVELFDKNILINKNSYKEIFSDIYKAFNYNYKLNEQSSNCFEVSGNYYPEMYLKTSFYLNEEVKKNSEYSVKRTLENLRKKGKKLFFATNSFYSYADMIMRASIGEDYKDLFDLCFYYAKKPIFFKEENEHIFSIQGDLTKYSLSEIEENSNLFEKIKKEKTLLGGSAKIVEILFKIFSKKEAENYIQNLNNNIDLNKQKNDNFLTKKFLYVGDNFSYDCLIPSLNKNWDTIAVDETLETGYIGRRNNILSEKWKLNFEDEIREYRYSVIKDNVKMFLTNVQLLNEFL